MRRIVELGAALLVLGLALSAGACSGGKKTAASAKANRAAGLGAPRRFPEFRVVLDNVDFLDPGLAYEVESWQAMFNVYLPLLGYDQRSGPAGATLVPVLAEDLPRISGDGRVYRLRLRPNLVYSNGRPVRASDVRYAIERLFRLDSPGVGFFANIEGAGRFAKTRQGHIAGIAANDTTREITFTLTRPQGGFQNVLAMLFAAPVPAGTPAKDRSTHPVPATGPYVISRYRPNRGFTLERNPRFEPLPNVAATNPDKIVVRLIPDAVIALQQTLNGNADYDLNFIPADRLGSLPSKQLKIYTPANTWYFFMNTRTPPFDKLAVRRAVNYAIDRDALVRLTGGLASPTENVLPPAYPQFRRHDLYPHDMSKARRLVRRAGATGQSVSVWTYTDDEPKKAGTYLADVLTALGFKVKVEVLHPSIYGATIGDQQTRAQIGVAAWYQDYPHPLDWFDVLLNGERITATHNNNYSNADVPAINETIDRLKREPTLTPTVNAQWAELDRQVMAEALWAPYLNRRQTDFFGRDVDMRCYVNHVVYLFEWGRICKMS